MTLHIDWNLAATIAVGILIATTVLIVVVFGWLAIRDD